MLAIEIMVEEILRLQNLTMFLQAQLQEARKMQETNWFVAHPEVMRFILKHEQAQELIGRMCAAPLVVLMEDEIIHTDDNPECDDPDCICHWERATQNEADIYGTHAPDCRCAWCDPTNEV